MAKNGIVNSTGSGGTNSGIWQDTWQAFADIKARRIAMQGDMLSIRVSIQGWTPMQSISCKSFPFNLYTLRCIVTAGPEKGTGLGELHTS